MTRRAIACFQQDWLRYARAGRTDGEHAPTSHPLCGQALNAALFLALYLLVFAALVLHAPAAVWQPGHRHIHLCARVDRRLALWLGRAASVPIGLVSLPGVPPLAPPDGASGGGRSGDGGELLAPEVFIVITSYPHPGRDDRGRVRRRDRRGGRATRTRSRSWRRSSRWPTSGWSRTCSSGWRPHPRSGWSWCEGRAPASATAWHGRCGRSRSRARAAEAVVIVQDGDAVLPPGCLARTLPFFRLLPCARGADHRRGLRRSDAGPAMRAWHRLRFAQRHLLMSSMALSRRLITLTGRMSAYRASIATDPGFIEIAPERPARPLAATAACNC